MYGEKYLNEKKLQNELIQIEKDLRKLKKQMVELVKKSFNIESEDIYRNEKVVKLVAPFEHFMFSKYYKNRIVDEAHRGYILDKEQAFNI